MPSQKARLLDLLLDGEWHTTVEIMNRVYGLENARGIARIGARIYDLKRGGYGIESRNEEGALWSYRLTSKPSDAPEPIDKEPMKPGQMSFLAARGY